MRKVDNKNNIQEPCGMEERRKVVRSWRGEVGDTVKITRVEDGD